MARRRAASPPKFKTWLVSVKPTNVLDGDGDVVLDDFGLPLFRDEGDALDPPPPLPPVLVSDVVSTPPAEAPKMAVTDEGFELILDHNGSPILDG